MAEGKGFEPLWDCPKRFSRPPRYDRFDIPPYGAHSAAVRRKHCVFHRQHHVAYHIFIRLSRAFSVFALLFERTDFLVGFHKESFYIKLCRGTAYDTAPLTFSKPADTVSKLADGKDARKSVRQSFPYFVSRDPQSIRNGNTAVRYILWAIHSRYTRL